MPAKLKVRNKTAEEITLQFPTGPRKIAASGVAEFSDAELRSPAFTRAHDAGTVAFAKMDDPSPEVITLGRSVLPPLVAAATTRLADLRGRYGQARAELLKLREAYNRTRRTAETNLDAGKLAADQTAELRNALTSLVLDTQTDHPDVVARKAELKIAAQAVETLKNEDLAVTGRTREVWYLERLAREQELQDANTALAKLTETRTDPLVQALARQAATLATDSAGLKVIKKDQALGAEIPPLD